MRQATETRFNRSLLVGASRPGRRRPWTAFLFAPLVGLLLVVQSLTGGTSAQATTFGAGAKTASTSGAVTDRFGVGYRFDALTFAAPNRGYGTNLFYYLRHDTNGFSTFGTISTSGAVTDRFGVGYRFDALTFAAPRPRIRNEPVLLPAT